MATRWGLIVVILAVAAAEGWLAVAGGIAPPFAVPLALCAAAATALALLTVDATLRRLRGPTGAQIRDALALLRGRLANDAEVGARIQRLSQATALLAAEPRLRAIEEVIARRGKEIEKLDGIADQLPEWRAAVAAWREEVRSVASGLLPSTEPPEDSEALNRAREKIPFHSNLSSASLRLALAYFAELESVANERRELSRYRDQILRDIAQSSP